MALSCPTAVWLLLVSANLVTGTTAPAEQSGSQGGQAGPYCTPDNWIGGRAVTRAVVSSSGSVTMNRTFAYITYSAPKQKMLVDGHMFVGSFARQIFDYPAKTLYTITGMNMEKCVKTALTVPFAPQCVPATATVTQVDSTLGVAPNTVKAFELLGKQNDVHYRVTLTTGSNVPIYERLWGNLNGVNFFETLSFYNFSIPTSIPDSTFTPPASCTSPSSLHVSARSSDEHAVRPFILYP